MTFGPESVSADADIRVDALRLLRIVRLRRELKVLCLIAAVAVPVWAAFTFGAESIMPRTSSAFWALNATIGPGFLIIFGVLVGAFLLLASSGLSGTARRTAARLSPVFGRTPQLEMADSAPEGERLYGLLRRRGSVRGVEALFFLVFTFVGVITGWNVWPAWQANHGHGGPIVTIGKTATIAGYTISSHGHRDYFLSTPYGRAIAEDYTPRGGQRWTVLPSDTGNGKAYLIGGYDYVLIGAIFLFCIVADAVVARRIVVAARAEHAARASVSGKLADSVAYLSSGHTIRLRIAGRRPGTVTLALRPLGGRSARAWLARRRLITTTATATAVAIGGTAIGLWKGGVFQGPPAQRNLTLAFLQPAGWEPGVSVSYTDLGSSTQLLQDGLRDAGAAAGHASVTASVLISPGPANGSGTADAAFADVASIGSVSPGTAVAAVTALERTIAQSQHGTATTLTGLPPGWQGVVTAVRSYDEGEADVVSGANGHLVWITLDGNYGSAGSLGRGGSELARAISGRGITRFVSAVAR